MNKVILMGRLTRDPETRTANVRGGETIDMARFTLAVDRRRQKDEEGQQAADFITCVLFGRSAAVLAQYAAQGTKLIVSGRIRTGSYTNREGRKIYTTDVVAEEWEFAESKASRERRGAGGGQDGRQPERQQEPQAQAAQDCAYRQQDYEYGGQSHVGEGFFDADDIPDRINVQFNLPPY